MLEILYDPFVLGFILIPGLTIILCGFANWRLENTRMVTGMCFLVSAMPAFGNIGFLVLAAIYTFIGFCSAFIALKIKKMLERRKGQPVERKPAGQNDN
ncbi:hypothetical protein LX24_02381 [Desulfallas thermosapovorans DSM 6562]|uniref:DUF2651 domain-containing protein n=1 Tax=Desulfallas thermosapovorans DSM 6562 TaxID=1121431 RepID=A0A5S4ZR39_9FIRM|nr:hypothetical protein LX24_02381 [Desulfallas thermosapovorans DSM 6562]